MQFLDAGMKDFYKLTRTGVLNLHSPVMNVFVLELFVSPKQLNIATICELFCLRFIRNLCMDDFRIRYTTEAAQGKMRTVIPAWRHPCAATMRAHARRAVLSPHEHSPVYSRALCANPDLW